MAWDQKGRFKLEAIQIMGYVIRRSGGTGLVFWRCARVSAQTDYEMSSVVFEELLSFVADNFRVEILVAI